MSMMGRPIPPIGVLMANKKRSNTEQGTAETATDTSADTATDTAADTMSAPVVSEDEAGDADKPSGQSADSQAESSEPAADVSESTAATSQAGGKTESETVTTQADESSTDQQTTVDRSADAMSDRPDEMAVFPAVTDAGLADAGPSSEKSAASTSTEVDTRTEEPAGRRASLKVAHVDPWSVTKIAFALSVALMIVAVIAVTILWVVLAVAGVWDQINSSVSTVLSNETNDFQIQDYLGFGRIIGFTLILSAINVIVFTAITAIGTRLYNIGADLLGGIDVTFSED